MPYDLLIILMYQIFEIRPTSNFIEGFLFFRPKFRLKRSKKTSITLDSSENVLFAVLEGVLECMS